MRSPWLDIALADYEGHMGLPEVAQAELLADVFGALLVEHAPRSVAILGCAGGNGFGRISPAVTDRVVDAVTPSAYSSVQSLAQSMTLVSPEELRRGAEGLRCEELTSHVVQSRAGKKFQVQVFRLS
jgi:hypothetical protein